MPSGAIVHKENFHGCMAHNDFVTLNSQGKFSRIELNLGKISTLKITHYKVFCVGRSKGKSVLYIP